MILLDKSSCDLLRYLIQLDHPETVMAISRAMEQSRRKIYYHLEKINDALPETVNPLVSQPRIGLLLDANQKKACQKLLDEVAADSYIMSIDERIQLMLVYIAVSPARVTIEKLMELTDVSRNTVLNDLNDIRYRLSQEQYKVNLYANKSQGYFLQCHPINKIQYVHSFLYDIFNEASDSFINILREKLALIFGQEELLSDQVQDFLLIELSQREHELGKKINRSEVKMMLRILPYLLLSYHNMDLTTEDMADIEQKFAPVYERIEYQVAKALSQSIWERIGIALDDVDTCLIAVLLLSYRKDKDTHISSKDFLEMTKTLTTFIEAFEEACGTIILNQEDLNKRLLTHVKSLIFRKQYGILSKNPLTKHIKEKYQQVFQAVKKVSAILEEAWQLELNDDDLAYLTIHFGGYINHFQLTSGPVLPKQVYIICDDGVAMQKLLLKQCQDYLPVNSIQAIFTSEQFKSVEDLLVADVLISTSDAFETQFPLIQVHPILSPEDVRKLQQFSRQHDFSHRLPYFEEQINQLLLPHLSQSDQAQNLSQAICRLFEDQVLASHFQGVTSEH
ncbi:transcription antiterminator [Streptococcus sp. sy010]|uniref:BglG family transcription antiterminator n=1 Tax=Streptococcus sp. sy010 TaxID=2600148 RepID=UPI0011B776D4|nr:transcription antiterminator [Streptococcus sp. sy010]TWT16274.1 transcription antiterminator [Streptococcus sp. sy010]